MDLQTLITQTQAYKTIANEFAVGKQAHAYFVQCADAMMQKDIALALSALVLCEKSNACKDCRACKNVAKQLHADLHFVGEQGKALSVEHINAMQEQLHLRGIEGENKVFVILNANEMSALHQNKLLKVLEEPPSNVTFLLLAQNQSSMLPTVLSRSRIVQFGKLETQHMLAYLDEKYPNNAMVLEAAYCSGGDLARACEWLDSQVYSTMFHEILDLLSVYTHSKLLLKTTQACLVYKPKFKQFLQVLSFVYRDCLAYKINPNLVQAKHVVANIQAIASLYSVAALNSILKQIEHAHVRLHFHCNATMLMDWLLFTILEERHKCQ